MKLNKNVQAVEQEEYYKGLEQFIKAVKTQLHDDYTYCKLSLVCHGEEDICTTVNKEDIVNFLEQCILKKE